MSKKNHQSFLVVTHYTISILTLIIIYLHANQILHIFPDKTAFFVYFSLNVIITLIGISYKYKNIKWNDFRVLTALVILLADIFILITTLFFTYKYQTAFYLIFMQICIKLAIVTADNLKII